MAVIVGLAPSCAHAQNGMTMGDMEATKRVANRLNEVIIFRSTGPWAKRWIEEGYPTKNFHVKGKSSDWGPQAGLVPYDGIYSKVGFNAAAALKGTGENDKGLKSGFAGRTQLVLTEAMINQHLNKPEGDPARTALTNRTPVPDSADLFLFATRSGDGATFVFRAEKIASDAYKISAYKQGLGADTRRLMFEQAAPLMVMTSGEAGAGNKPMTGDYDLLAICPTWAQYGSQAPHDIVKPGIQLHGRPGAQPAARFYAGQGMDNVLDPSLHTHGTRLTNWDAMNAAGLQRGILRNPQAANRNERLPAKNPERAEHPDMGNLTPRILRCINELNIAMGAVGAKAALRRVHHNAESHRNAMFGALTRADMETTKPGERYGDGFPFTIFQPDSLMRAPSTARYGDVCTIENLMEFRTYATELFRAGYFVPKNWVWELPRMTDMTR